MESRHNENTSTIFLQDSVVSAIGEFKYNTEAVTFAAYYISYEQIFKN